jgi:hypothetical protein
MTAVDSPEGPASWAAWWRRPLRHPWKLLCSGPDLDSVWSLALDMTPGRGDLAVLPSERHPGHPQLGGQGT